MGTVKRTWLVVALCLLLVAIDAALAAKADADRFGTSGWLVAADVATGLALIIAAVCAKGPVGQRFLVAVVGAAWLVGSWLPVAASLHQGLLVVALLAFPLGRIRGLWRWLVAALAVPVALGVDQQIAVSAVFALTALVVLIGGAPGYSAYSARLYPGLAAAACALTLAVSSTLADGAAQPFNPTVASLAWQAAIVLIAAGFLPASRAAALERVRRAQDAVGSESDSGLAALAAVLGPAVGDPELRIYRWRDAAASYVDDEGRPMTSRAAGLRQQEVYDGAAPVAIVVHASDALDDPLTARAVAEAVRLTVSNSTLREELRDRLVDLEASRLRLFSAADRARQQVAADLRQSVEPALATVGQEVTGALTNVSTVSTAGGDEAASAALQIALHELTVLAQELRDLLRGVPPIDLGRGRLRGVLDTLFSGIPLRHSVTIAADAAWDERIETVLFYVCAEALTNSVKHSDATRIDVVIRQRSNVVEMHVTDDGCGGADPNGSGLRGLADRLAASSGRLRVNSPPGAGTVLRAEVDTAS